MTDIGSMKHDLPDSRVSSQSISLGQPSSFILNFPPIFFFNRYQKLKGNFMVIRYIKNSSKYIQVVHNFCGVLSVFFSIISAFLLFFSMTKNSFVNTLQWVHSNARLWICKTSKIIEFRPNIFLSSPQRMNQKICCRS